MYTEDTATPIKPKDIFLPQQEPTLVLASPQPLSSESLLLLKPLTAKPRKAKWWQFWNRSWRRSWSKNWKHNRIIEPQLLLAENTDGQIVSLYLDEKTGQFFLHGFFD